MALSQPGFSQPGLRMVGQTVTAAQADGMPMDGLVGYWRFDEGRNLLKYSQQIDNAAWTKTRCTITPNVALAPDGTMTADKIVEDATAGASHFVSQGATLAASTTYTPSVYLKAGERTWAFVDFLNKDNAVIASAYINLATGALGTAVGSVGVLSDPNAPGWYRPYVAGASGTGGTSPLMRVYIAEGDGDITIDGDITKGIYVWGAQLEVGSSPGPYVATTDKQLLMDYSRPRKNLLLPNQANGTSDGTTTGFTAVAGATLTSSTEQFWQGSRSLKVVTPNAATAEGASTQGYYTDLPRTGMTVTGSARVYGSGTVRLYVHGYTDGGTTPVQSAYVAITLRAGWDTYSVPITFTDATVRRAAATVVTASQQAATFYVDALQLEEGSVATPWEAPPNIGILGSELGDDTNDPTWTKEGASFAKDDYIAVGPVSPSVTLGSLAIVFNAPANITTASPANALVNITKSNSPNDFAYVMAGSGIGELTDELINIVYQTGPGAAYGTSWCSTGGSISAGAHLLFIVWNGGSYDIYLDNVKKATTAFLKGHALQMPVTDVVFGALRLNGTPTLFLAAVEATAAIWSRPLTESERLAAIAAIKADCAAKGVILP